MSPSASVPSPGDALPPLDDGQLAAIEEGRFAWPHSVLGSHRLADGRRVVRARRPLAASVEAVLEDGSAHRLAHVGHGIWQAVVPDGGYRVRAAYPGGEVWEADDPARFEPTVGELDLYLFGEGRHEQLWEVLGAHPRTIDGVDGVAFAVWAPRARAARVIGDFNGWSGEDHAMRRLSDLGVWELFVPGVGVGRLYKFALLTERGWVTRADPMAQWAELPPSTASRVARIAHEWHDDEWMRARAQRSLLEQPMSIYELHFGSWRPGLSYRDAAEPLVEYVTDLGFTHVEFMPLAEHPFEPSWGYQVTGYYAATSRFGAPDDLRYLIDRLHQAGIGVIVDWVPGHFPRDEWALANFDGHPLYEHPDPRRGEQPDWGTLVFDFGQPQVRNFLVANALFWLESFHVDGLRVDAVASILYLDYSRQPGQWLPNIHGGRENLEAITFLQEVSATASKRSPGIAMVAEESTAWPGVTAPTDSGGLGFDLKWNMGWMHDTLQYVERDPMYRSWHRGELTFSLVYAWSEHFVLPISHDEVVYGKGSLYGKMPGDEWQKRANVRAYLTFMWAHPGKKLLFMGQEYGQPGEWSQQRGLDWWVLEDPRHAGLQQFTSQLNRVYRQTPALWQRDDDPGGFEWLAVGSGHDDVFAWLRWDASGSCVAVVVNYSGRPVGPFRLPLPFGGAWREVLNSDAVEFGGSGVGNLGVVHADAGPHGGRPASADITIPPLGGLYLTPAT